MATTETTTNCTYKFIRAGYHEIYNVCSGTITKVDWGLADYANCLFFVTIGVAFVAISYMLYKLSRKM